MDKGWRNLIILAVIFFAISLIWELVNVLDGTRSSETRVVVEMPREKLFTVKLKDFLTSE